jgi:pimeloyl-ACP methyl ester carboxylesterase
MHHLISLPVRLLTSLLLLLAVACGGPSEGDLFFLRSKDADMPIWVRGNTESGTFVLFLHGGPGSSALAQAGLHGLGELEKQYAIVYWDQRASGSSQGNVEAATLTLEQFVEDTDQVIDVVRERYAPKRLFLMGHSWGGGLGTAYLTDPARQAKVAGWIEIDGAHDLVRGYVLARERMLRYTAERIAAGDQAEHWTEVQRFYEERPTLLVEDLIQHSRYVRESKGYTHDPSRTSKGLRSDFFFFSPSDVFSVMHNEPETVQRFDVLKLDLTSQMGRITVPSLILWGRHDGILPVELATQAHEALGTPAERKQVVIFEQSAHSPLHEEPEAAVQAIRSFIDR